MNNLSPYCGLVDARISASDKDLGTCKNWPHCVRKWWTKIPMTDRLIKLDLITDSNEISPPVRDLNLAGKLP